MRDRPKVTIEDTFMDNTMIPIFRVRRNDLMVACIHYRWSRADKDRISRTQAKELAESIRLRVR